MSHSTPITPGADLDRRSFVKVSGTFGAGLALAVTLPPPRRWQRPTDEFHPNAFLRIDPEGGVTIWVGQSEMGQGVRTSLPMLVAEELDADWDRVSVVQADAHPTRYGSQMTGGSSAVRTSYLRLRQAGAAAREMLKQAAAQEWGVSADACTTHRGYVVHEATARRIGYGALTATASRLEPMEDPPLKTKAEFSLLRTGVGRTDTPLKVDGSAVFGMDVRVPGMLHGTVVRSPRYGATIQSFDPAAALAVPGVKNVFRISAGIAVVAENTWQAFEGAAALDVRWSGGSTEDSSQITELFRDLCEQEGTVARDEGDAMGVLGRATSVIEAVYEVPYLAHACMEPMNCTAHVTPGGARVWAPTQDPQTAQRMTAEIAGLELSDVDVRVTFLGGGFGRRAETDFVRDAVESSKEMGVPVQITWTREETTRHDFYRPATYNRFRATLDPAGAPSAWSHRIVGQSIWERFFGSPPPGGLDPASVEGAANLPYGIPNLHVDCCTADVSVPVGWWRSVGSSQNAFVTESFIDELAHAAGQDPVAYRLALLQDHPRHRAVLEKAAEASGWGSSLPPGRARGVAIAESFGSYVAEVAEVSMEEGRLRVHSVTCAVDCGHYVNPNTVAAQMEGAIVFGLTAALRGRISIREGAADQSNFHDYEMLRYDEMPEVTVHIVDSGEDPGGVGEPGTPPVAPAVANAVFALTGRRIRRLPLEPELAE